MSVVFFTLPGNPHSVQMLETISTLRMQGCAPGFEVACSNSVPATPGTAVGLFDSPLSLSGKNSGTRHLGMYAPQVLAEYLGQNVLTSQGWPQWVQELTYAVAVGEAAVGNEVVHNRAHFILHTFTQGAKVNARKKGRLPWGQSLLTLSDPRCRFDWQRRRAGSCRVLTGAC